MFGVFQWLVDDQRPDGGVKLLHIDPSRVAVGGYSAGANLASGEQSHLCYSTLVYSSLVGAGYLDIARVSCTLGLSKSNRNA